MSQFDKEFEKLVDVEGGYANNPNDSGGETMWGVTIAVARRNGYNGPMRAMPKEVGKRIYKSEYWDTMFLDEVAKVSERIASEIFDTGVNMGEMTAQVFLQQILNALNRNGIDYPDVKEDGKIGPKTVDCLRKFIKLRKLEGEIVALKMLNVLQGHKYISLARARAKDEAFVFGWFRTRISIPV